MSRYKRYYWAHRETRLQEGKQYYEVHKKDLLKEQWQKRRLQLASYQRLVEEAKQPIKTTEREVTVYLAGIIDGEGTISIEKVTLYDPTHKRPFYLRPILKVENTDKEMVQLVQTGLELTAKPWLHKEERENRKDTWRISSNNTKEVLNALIKLRPYLRTKREQADTAMEFCLQRLFTRHKYTEKELELTREIRALNLKGKGQL